MSWSVSDSDSDSNGDGAPPVFLAPPPEELCRPLAVSFVLARTDATAVLVQAIRVHSTGCMLDVQWIRRRQSESDHEWNSLQEEAHTFLIDYLDDPDGLKIRFDPDDSMSNSLGATGASLQSDDDRITGKLALWLTPLPAQVNTRLVCSWDRYGLQNTFHDLDVAAINVAAQQATTPWP